jgi:DNA polymerase I
MDPRQTLLVIDGTALLFRAFFGGAGGRAADGTEVGAARAVVNRVAATLRNEPAGHVAMVYDAGKITFRNELFPAYKANRGDPPPELVPQFDLVRRATAAVGLASFCVPGFEADDLVATLARCGREAGVSVRLMSVDKDLAQLVVDAHPAVQQEDPWTGTVWDEAGVMKRLGVPPHKAVAFQAMCGDATDNVPGVKGVGAKTAATLLQHFDGIEHIYDNIDAVAEVPVRGAKTLGAKLLAGREGADMALRLVKLRTDAPLGVTDPIAATRFLGPPVAVDPVLQHIGLGGVERRFGRVVMA